MHTTPEKASVITALAEDTGTTCCASLTETKDYHAHNVARHGLAPFRARVPDTLTSFAAIVIVAIACTTSPDAYSCAEDREQYRGENGIEDHQGDNRGFSPAQTAGAAAAWRVNCEAGYHCRDGDNHRSYECEDGCSVTIAGTGTHSDSPSPCLVPVPESHL